MKRAKLSKRHKHWIVVCKSSIKYWTFFHDYFINMLLINGFCNCLLALFSCICAFCLHLCFCLLLTCTANCLRFVLSSGIVICQYFEWVLLSKAHELSTRNKVFSLYGRLHSGTQPRRQYRSKKSGDTVQLEFSDFLCTLYLGQATGWDRNQSGSTDRICFRI